VISKAKNGENLKEGDNQSKKGPKGRVQKGTYGSL